ncbi:structural protein [Flavobacterium phage vB_FspM_immuto_3-5A]|uniref:Structural protein n=1 Tax=Flavobacterium phage vB_FspM_immuto_2-6A TaxID=2801477 RepID=A0A7T8ERL4_9CAUD|nr:structural protein [Flavobacterium phage vB_FspM_immuto_2-6A]QQO91899.1 structural protein [Flavobacterium phage vB_FspM_immuto_2-6A]QQO92137.1 structural protein [Flavobacterium phage vB_FspM_immuto_3-5A]QQO92375.1 structural protein [Flavobacterium phage vB_FspM_immuto_13-6C]
MAEIHGPKVVRDGLVLNLDAADINSYPGSGTTWYDISGNSGTGTLINGTSFSSNSIVFDGSNDYVNIPDSTALRLNGNFTISLWHRGITKTNNFPGPLFKGNSVNVGGGYILYYTSVSNGTMAFKRENQQFGLTNAVNTFWSHITFTYNGTNVRGYLNGINTYLSGTVTFTTNTDSTSLQLGRGDQYGNAAIANISMYNRALSAQEIQQNYNATKTRFGL